MQALKDSEWMQHWLRAHRLPKSNWLAAWGVVAALSILALGGLRWWPMQQRMETLSQGIDQSLGTLQGQAELLTQQMALEQDLLETRQLLPRLMQALPRQNEVPQLLRGVYEGMGNQGIGLQEFTPQAPVVHEVLTEVPVKVVLQGPASEIGTVPVRVALLSRKIMLNEFELFKAKDGLWELKGTLVAFAQPQLSMPKASNTPSVPPVIPNQPSAPLQTVGVNPSAGGAVQQLPPSVSFGSGKPRGVKP